MSRPTSLSPPADAAVPEPRPGAPAVGAETGKHYDGCFACGEVQDNGLRVRSRVGQGVSVHTEYVVGEGHQGAPGLAHGGLLTCALDEALGALSFLLHRPVVTARLETDFRRPVPVGSTLHIHAWCTGVDGRKVFARASGRVDAADGPVAVEAAALFVRVDLDHFTTHGRAEDVERAGSDPHSAELMRTYEVSP
ncbi:PaaI family thioesterase [Yinghuangia sp. ASG 101]|uniref:PaaI family thioesterase n=1 Tax=Yinghuangia sp. ASG 101 TaxID=2896848 RepID=UPI001E52E338|nr:hotdog fold domain-containing protein [Yinghuangia sp. ASG 101]UGQ13852.1 PaaI family thioesterase [Yinghuangia sp. ASG 101]